MLSLQETIMQQPHPRQRVWYDDPIEDEATSNRQTASLGGVAVALFLIVVGLFLVHALHSKALIEDCLLEGRTNCSVLVQPTP
jgi:hypothetical protein